jgi:N-acyl-D-amino-acid deacylase
MWDTLFRNASVVDGTGKPAVEADVAVKDGKIAAIGQNIAGEADKTHDLSGRYLAPGFIDIHSHADFVCTLSLSEQAELQRGKIWQGITTEIVGNCGLGPAPLDNEGLVPKIMSWMSPDGTEWRWKSLGEYLDVVQRQGTLLNMGALQPHGPLRLEARGLKTGETGEGERRMMRRRLEEAMEAGAFGLSCGLIYPPGMYTSSDELTDLAGVAARCGGVFTSHVRGSSELLLPAVEEILKIGRQSGVHVHHSHNEAFGRDHWHKVTQVLEMEEQASRLGQPVTFDMFPYTAAATMMIAIYPPWSLEGGVPRLLERLSDPEQRRRIEESIRETVPSWPPWHEGGWPHNLVLAAGWDQIFIGRVRTQRNKYLEGVSLAELADLVRKTPFDAISDLMIEEDGVISQLIFGVSGDASDDTHLLDIMRHPLGALCTDANDYGHGLPHPAAYGAYPRLLGHYVRDRRVVSLEEAVRKMTSYPARIFSILDRGQIVEGYWADLVAFDFEKLNERATYREPRQLAEGIEGVFINGACVLWQGEYRPAAAGQVLRR